MTTEERSQMDEMRREIQRLSQEIQRIQGGAGGQASSGSKYVLSDDDRRRSEADKQRNDGFAAKAGPRPIGGFPGSTSVARTDMNFNSGQAFDMVSNLTQGGGSRLPAGYGPEEFTICDSGSPVTRNFITDNPD